MKVSYTMCDGCHSKNGSMREVEFPEQSLDLCAECIDHLLFTFSVNFPPKSTKVATVNEVQKKKPLAKKKKRKVSSKKKKTTSEFIKELKEEVGLTDHEILDREEIIKRHDASAKKSRAEMRDRDHVKEILEKFSK